jgi:hypothetical protein
MFIGSEHPVDPFVRLDRDKAHVLAFDDHLRIDEVVLVGLRERLYELHCDPSHIMALLPQRTAQKMCSRTRPLAKSATSACRELFLCELFIHQHLASRAERHKMKVVLPQLNESAYRCSSLFEACHHDPSFVAEEPCRGPSQDGYSATSPI